MTFIRLLESYLTDCSETVAKAWGTERRFWENCRGARDQNRFLLGNSCTTDVILGSVGIFAYSFSIICSNISVEMALKISVGKTCVHGCGPWIWGKFIVHIISSKTSLCLCEEEDIRDSDSLDTPVLSTHQNLGFFQIFPSFQILELTLCLIYLRLSHVDYTPCQRSYSDRFTVLLNCTSGLQLQHDSDKHDSYFPWHWKCSMLICQPK